MAAPQRVAKQYQAAKYYTKGPDGVYYEVMYSKDKGPDNGYYWTATAQGWGPGKGYTEIPWKKAAPESQGGIDAQGKPIPLKATTFPVVNPDSSLRYPMDAVYADSDYVTFSFYEYQPPFRKQGSSSEAFGFKANYNQADKYTTTVGRTVVMYMPEDISAGFKANWGGKAVSSLTRDALASAGGDTFADKIKGAGETLSKVGGRLPINAATAAIKTFVGRFTGDTLTQDDLLGSIGGVIYNPNVELLFSGTDLRNFTLRFKLFPRDNVEAGTCDKIVREFRRQMLPTTTVTQVFNFGSNQRGTSEGFIKVPNVCKVTFMQGGDIHPYLPQYKICAITGVDVNYTPDGAYATYIDGRPVATELVLNFQEMKLVFGNELPQEGASL